MNINFGGLFITLIMFGAAIGFAIWGIVVFFTDDGIRVDKKIVPEVELIIKDNKVDTVYVYRFP